MGRGKQGSQGNLPAPALMGLSLGAPGTTGGLPIQPPRPSAPKTPFAECICSTGRGRTPLQPPAEWGRGEKSKYRNRAVPGLREVHCPSLFDDLREIWCICVRNRTAATGEQPPEPSWDEPGQWHRASLAQHLQTTPLCGQKRVQMQRSWLFLSSALPKCNPGSQPFNLQLDARGCCLALLWVSVKIQAPLSEYHLMPSAEGLQGLA